MFAVNDDLAAVGDLFVSVALDAVAAGAADALGPAVIFTFLVVI